MQATTVPLVPHDQTHRMMPPGALVPLVTTAPRGRVFPKDAPLATSPMPQETWTFLDVNFAQRVRLLCITVEGIYYNWGYRNNQKMIINVVIIILLRFCLLASLFLWSSIDHDSTCRNLFWYLVGYYCETTGLSAPTGECSMGYYCPAGQNVSNPTAYICTPGHYCPAGSPSEVSCSSGLYQNEAGQVRKGSHEMFIAIIKAEISKFMCSINCWEPISKRFVNFYDCTGKQIFS